MWPFMDVNLVARPGITGGPRGGFGLGMTTGLDIRIASEKAAIETDIL